MGAEPARRGGRDTDSEGETEQHDDDLLPVRSSDAAFS